MANHVGNIGVGDRNSPGIETRQSSLGKIDGKSNVAIVEKGYDVYNMAVQHIALDGIISVLVLIILAIIGNLGYMTSEIFWKGLISGLFAGVGTILINYAIA